MLIVTKKISDLKFQPGSVCQACVLDHYSIKYWFKKKWAQIIHMAIVTNCEGTATKTPGHADESGQCLSSLSTEPLKKFVAGNRFVMIFLKSSDGVVFLTTSRLANNLSLSHGFHFLSHFFQNCLLLETFLYLRGILHNYSLQKIWSGFLLKRAFFNPKNWNNAFLGHGKDWPFKTSWVDVP